MKDIYEAVSKAKELALKNNIRANMVILDEHFAKTNGFTIKEYKSYQRFPPMILGLNIAVSHSELSGIADFALLESNYTNEVDELKRENAELKAKLHSIKYALGIKDDEDEDNEH